MYLNQKEFKNMPTNSSNLDISWYFLEILRLMHIGGTIKVEIFKSKFSPPSFCDTCSAQEELGQADQDKGSYKKVPCQRADIGDPTTHTFWHILHISAPEIKEVGFERR